MNGLSIVAQARDNPTNGNKEVVFRNCTPFTDYIIEIKVDNAKHKSR